MSDYVATARSNYFKVKDLEKFTDFCASFGGDVEPGTAKGNAIGKHCIIFQEGIPSELYDEKTEEHVEFDILKELSKHLVAGEVAILTESGHEGHRYMSGFAMAVNAAGEFRDVGIDAIYKLAEELTTPVKAAQITRATY